MSKSSFEKVWTDVGELVANGGKLNRSDFHAIYDVLNIANFHPDCLPGEKIVKGSASERKDAIFELAQKIWGKTPGQWLNQEKKWLIEARKAIGSTDTGGKEKIYDVITAEILVRLVAVARYVTETDDGYPSIDEAIAAINTMLYETCAKGRTRMMKVNGHAIHTELQNYGIMIGSGGCKYLPYPEKAMPELLLFLLDKNNVLPEVYKDF